MTHEQLRQIARQFLAKAFEQQDTSAHVIQAALAIAVSEPPLAENDDDDE